MHLHPFSRLLLILALFTASGQIAAQPNVILPRTGITANEIGLLINDNDPVSRQVGAYYQKARQIPNSNVIHLRFPAGGFALSEQYFKPIKEEIDRRTPRHVQAYAVAWTKPYVVGCMSMTSALAFGFDPKYCSQKCAATAPSSYFNSESTRPFDDHQMRPAMMLAGMDFEHIKTMIDRGVASDRSFPEGTAYLLNTSDKSRSVRASQFGLAKKELSDYLPIKQFNADFIKDRKDVLFYFTGMVFVPHLETLEFMPGALADHLTSAGGALDNIYQMSILRWIEAGATASYGTVGEPCNHRQKFPLPAAAMFHYLIGATAIEAYWKSVAWPGEGLFVGEPLASPFKPDLKPVGQNTYELKLISPLTMSWRLDQADTIMGPYEPTSIAVPVERGRNRVKIQIPADSKAYLRLVR